MGKVYFKLDGPLELVAGYDKPFATWYAQLYDARFGEQTDDDSPAKTLGYTPDERALSHADTEHGPYPIRTFEELEYHLGDWDIALTPEMCEKIRRDGP